MKKLFVVMFLLFANIGCGKTASWYGKEFDGKHTASGYIFNSKAYTCASNTYDFGTVLKVTNIDNGKSVIVVVTDRGGFSKMGREIDLSRAAFLKIANPNAGLIKVKIKVLDDDKTFKYKHGSPVFTAKEYKRYVED